MIDIGKFLMANRVALTGTHGVGKTTLLDEIVAYKSDFGFPHIILPEIARDLLHAKKRRWFELSADEVFYMQSAIYNGHMYMIHNTEHFVADRSIIDHTAYVFEHIRNERATYELKQLFSKQLSEIDNLSKYYDMIIYYSPEGLELTEDQKVIDDHIKRFLFTKRTKDMVMTITRKDLIV